MLPFVGLVFLAGLFFPFVPPLLQYIAFGALFGGTGGRAAIVWSEWRKGEMHPDRVRRIEFVGIAAGVSLMFFAAVAQAALAHL